jgi:hypothetical protein
MAPPASGSAIYSYENAPEPFRWIWTAAGVVVASLGVGALTPLGQHSALALGGGVPLLLGLAIAAWGSRGSSDPEARRLGMRRGLYVASLGAPAWIALAVVAALGVTL